VVHDIGSYEGQPFIVMEYLESKTLKDYTASRRLAIKEILDIALTLIHSPYRPPLQLKQPITHSLLVV